MRQATPRTETTASIVPFQHAVDQPRITAQVAAAVVGADMLTTAFRGIDADDPLQQAHVTSLLRRP